MGSKGSPPYRVLYLHGDWLVGGAKQDVITMVRGLDRTRFEPLVACPEGALGLSDELTQSHVRFLPVRSLPGWRKLKSFPLLPFVIYQLSRMLVRERIALLHVNDYWWAPHCIVAAKLAGIACVVHIRLALEAKRVRQYWLAKPDHVIACSRDVFEVVKAAGVPSDRLSLIYSGLPAYRLEPLDGVAVDDQIEKLVHVEPGTLVIGTMARLTPRKGIEDLLRAFHLVRDRWQGRLKLLMVGGEGHPDYERLLHDLAHQLGIDDAVTFAGHQDHVLPFLKSMDIFVLAARSEEGGPIALLEAMAMERPIVSTSVGGIPEFVLHGQTGYIVPPCDPQGLSQAILQLLEDPEMRGKMGQAGRARVEECFTSERTLASLMNVYTKLLANAQG